MQEGMGYWREQIHEIFPDIHIDSIEWHREGLVNDVLILNEAWVIRFTKTDWGEDLLDQEHRLLQLIQPHLTLATPQTKKHRRNILVYPYLTGESFLRAAWVKAPPLDQQAIADQLGEFLQQLQSINTNNLDWDVPLTLAPVTRETWVDIHRRLLEHVSPLLLPHQEEWMTSLFEAAMDTEGFFDFDPVLVHGDLAPYHILYSPDEHRLKSVIDFGTAGIGDPATDLGSLISSYGETLVEKVAGQYPRYEELLQRARFFAQADKLQWVLLGVETGETYWFTSHLGGAQDIRNC